MEFILSNIMLQPNCGLTKKQQQMLLRFTSYFHWSFPRTSAKLLSIVHLVTCDIVSWLCKQAPVPAFHIRIWRSNVPPPDASTFRCHGHQDTAYKIEQKKELHSNESNQKYYLLIVCDSLVSYSAIHVQN